MSSSKLDNETFRLCIFLIGKQRFAVDIMRVREIVRPSAITPVPKSPFGMEGLIDLRGEVLPLFDLRLRFDLKARASIKLPKARFLITRVGGRQLGLAVDHVLEVIDVKRDALKVNANKKLGLNNPFFVGVCPHGDYLAILLNLHRILSNEDKVAIDRLSVP